MSNKLPLKRDFQTYEAVRSSGNWNMFDPKARRATGLDRNTYYAVVRNYEALMKRYPDVRPEGLRAKKSRSFPTRS